MGMAMRKDAGHECQCDYAFVRGHGHCKWRADLFVGAWAIGWSRFRGKVYDMVEVDIRVSNDVGILIRVQGQAYRQAEGSGKGGEEGRRRERQSRRVRITSVLLPRPPSPSNGGHVRQISVMTVWAVVSVTAWTVQS